MTRFTLQRLRIGAWLALGDGALLAAGAALCAGDQALAEDYRRQADALQQSPARADAADDYDPHDLSPAELGKLADTLDPLLRIATGAWLLRPAAGGRYQLLVLARDAALLRLIGRLTGEPSYLRRDCEQLLGRLLPRLRLDVQADIMAAGDPRLAWCVEQARVRRPVRATSKAPATTPTPPTRRSTLRCRPATRPRPGR